eukprot:COSAG01_NODE_3275_length_6319_cov_8.374277_10_plen_59_part_00
MPTYTHWLQMEVANSVVWMFLLGGEKKRRWFDPSVDRLRLLLDLLLQYYRYHTVRTSI